MSASDFAWPVTSLRNMPATQPPTIGDAVIFEFITARAYALLIVLGTGQPGALFGASVESWIDLSTPTVRVLSALVAVPGGAAGGTHSDAVWVYRHILAACILIACGHFICSRRHWRYRSEHLSGSLSAATGGVEKRRSMARRARAAACAPGSEECTIR